MIFLMMRISIDNVEHELFKGILYCESLKLKFRKYPAIHTHYSVDKTAPFQTRKI